MWGCLMYVDNLDETKLKTIQELEKELPGALLALACRRYDEPEAESSSVSHLKPVSLTPDQHRKLAALEDKLGFCLFAVENPESLYVLEAKLAPNVWRKVTKVYPDIRELKDFYLEREEAHNAKSRLKRILGTKPEFRSRKKPIRNRKVG